jgi:RHS repeat-associated protein
MIAFGQPYLFAADGASIAESQYGNRFLFTGREWLKGLDIYDYRHRLYQPELGRFLQPDPKHFEAGDYNLYRYCHNDPVNKTDPTGLILIVDPTTPLLFQLIEYAALNEASRAPSVQAAITQLQNSSNLHVITMKTDTSAGAGLAGGRSETTEPIGNKQDAINKIGTGSLMRINPFEQSSSKDTIASQVAHAIGHAQEIDSGTAVPSPKGLSPQQYISHPSERNALTLEMEVKNLQEKRK